MLIELRFLFTKSSSFIKQIYSFLSSFVIFPFNENLVVKKIELKPENNTKRTIAEIRKNEISEFFDISEGRLANVAAKIPTKIP